MAHDRRSVLAALGLTLPFGFDPRAVAAAPAVGPAPVLTLRPFEVAVREAFARPSPDGESVRACRGIEIGHSEAVLAGLQGCYNDRPFAGFPAGHLRIVRTGSKPGPVVSGVRLFVATVDVAHTRGRTDGLASRPFDFNSIPPAPLLAAVALPPSDGAAIGVGRRPTGAPDRH